MSCYFFIMIDVDYIMGGTNPNPIPKKRNTSFLHVVDPIEISYTLFPRLILFFYIIIIMIDIKHATSDTNPIFNTKKGDISFFTCDTYPIDITTTFLIHQ